MFFWWRSWRIRRKKFWAEPTLRWGPKMGREKRTGGDQLKSRLSKTEEWSLKANLINGVGGVGSFSASGNHRRHALCYGQCSVLHPQSCPWPGIHPSFPSALQLFSDLRFISSLSAIYLIPICYYFFNYLSFDSYITHCLLLFIGNLTAEAHRQRRLGRGHGKTG